MIDLKNHPYFEEFTDPKSGVTSYILTERVAEFQKHFYFTNTSLTYDSKYLWILCCNPPMSVTTFAVVSLDPKNPCIKYFPQAGYLKGANIPAIIPRTHDLIFAVGRSVYKLTVEGEVTKIYTLPVEMTRGRNLDCLFTHASFSCDNKKLVMDVHIDEVVYVGFLNLETGEAEFIDDCFIPNHNHAQFSTTDPELILIDQEGWNDSKGNHHAFKNRTWLLDTKGTRFEPLIQSSWFGKDGTKICHDFWSKDGMICYQDYEKGAYECDIQTREITHVWKRPICHCHTNYNRMYWVADQTPYEWKEKPCKLLFYDRETKKEIEIFSAMPMHNDPGRTFHIDPHPAFTDDGEYIISTTTVRDGKVDVAITPVKPLVELCREKGNKMP